MTEPEVRQRPTYMSLDKLPKQKEPTWPGQRRWNPIRLDTPVSLEYWQDGSHTIIPPVADARTERLKNYQRLYDGDTEPLGLLGKERIVYINYFARLSDMVQRLLMAFPPAYEGLNESILPVDDINDALATVIIDLTRYGTGLFWSAPRPEQGSLIRRLTPSRWYPANENASMSGLCPCRAAGPSRRTAHRAALGAGYGAGRGSVVDARLRLARWHLPRRTPR